MSSSTSTPSAPGLLARTGLAGALLWYGVLGGAAAWAVHLGVAWSVMELACLADTPGGVNQRGGDPGSVARTVVGLGTAVPALVTVGALAACWLLRRRIKRIENHTDQLALERSRFLVLTGVFLNLLFLAAIAGGGVALMVLEPCG